MTPFLTDSLSAKGHTFCILSPVLLVTDGFDKYGNSQFFSQSEQSEKFSKSSDWLKKAGPPKKPLLL